MAERWLVISHEATNSGAPRMLLRVLQGVRAARGPGWSCEILLVRDGALRAEFERIGRVHVLAHPWSGGTSLRAGLLRKFYDRPWRQPRRLERVLSQVAKGRFDLVYNNTATNGSIVPAVRRFDCAVVTHVHELGSVLREFLTPAELAATLTHSDRFIAVSDAVATDLADLGVDAKRVAVVPNFIESLPPAATAGDRANLGRTLGLPNDAAIVTGCGHLHSIKGADVFVEVAAEVAAQARHPVFFLWLGGETDRRFARQVRRLVRRRGLESRVRFVGAVGDVTPWLAGSDVVAVTSRVESFSLVALEAAALGRPVVGFQGARGLDTALGGRPELLIPGFDHSAMAASILRLLHDPAGAALLGGRLRAKVSAEFLSGPRIADILAVVAAAQSETGRRP